MLRLLKNYIFVKKCFVISFWMFRTSNIAFYSFTLYYCVIFNSLDATIRMSNSLDPDQAQHFVGPDLGLGLPRLRNLVNVYASSSNRNGSV